MNKYKSIKFLIENNLVDMSQRNVNNLAKELYNKNDGDVIIVKTDRNLNKYLINIEAIDKFIRKRARKKMSNVPKILYIDLRKKPKFNINKYDINICLNFKSDNIADGSSYDTQFYKYIAVGIYKLIKKDMYYVIEKDSSGSYHLHMGCEGLKDIDSIRRKIQKYLWNNFLLKNEYFYKDNQRMNTIYIEPMVSDYANRTYLAKGNDKLGGVKLNFLNAYVGLNAA